MRWKKIVILILTLMNYSIGASAQNFQVITSSSARKMMSEHEPVLIKKMERNDCSVFKLSSKQYIIFSNESKYSLSFDKLDKLKEIEKMKIYPVGLETDDIREKEQQLILDVPNTVNSNVKELELKFEIKLNYSDVKILDSLDEKIVKLGIDNLTERDVFLISLYLDEFFRVNTEDTFWAIEKVYTLNTYWIPYLKRKDSKDEFSFYRTIFKSYFENESGMLNLKFNYLLQLADYKGLRPLSDEHINFIKSFQ